MRRKCRSLRMIEWSRHSRLTLPIRRSTYGFCHGLRGAVTTSSTPIAVTVERNDCPYAPSRSRIRLSLLLTPSGAETLVFWVSQPLAWLVAPKDVPLMTRRGDLKLSHGATAKARENAVKQDRVPTTNAIKSL